MGGARRNARAGGTIALALASVLLDVAPASSFGISYPDLVSIAAGARTDVVALLAPSPSSWAVEVSDRDLFDGAGLRVTGVRAASLRGPWRGEVEAVAMSAAVGQEALMAARLGWSTASWSLALGSAHEVVDIAGAAPVRLTTLHLRTGVSLSPRLHVRCDADGFRVAGLALRGADIETSVTAVAGAGVAVTSALVVDRTRGAHARVSAAVGVYGHAVLVAGYNDESDAVSLALAVVAGGVRGVVGACLHPVLGASRGVSVRWGR